MSTLTIGNIERNLDEVDESWLNQQINRRRTAGESVCVKVHIKTAYLDLLLATQDCPRGGGGRPPTAKEQEIISLWNRLHLSESNFTGGNIIAFRRQLDRYL